MSWTQTTQVTWLMPLVPWEQPDLLAVTLLCLERQTLQADELVIAADGPLSASLKDVLEQCSLPWLLHQQSEHQGIGATLAQVAPYCRGEFIVRIDSDDIYAPEHTETVVNALRTDEGLGVVGCQLIEIDTNHQRYQSSRTTPTDAGEALHWLPWRNPLNHQTVAIRKQALVSAGGYQHCPSFEDWDLWLRITGAGYNIKSLPSCTTAARVNSNHLKRRRGLSYAFLEWNFYCRQINERRLQKSVALLACLSRLPWRLSPKFLLRWWMHSHLRSSPTIDSSWVTELLNQIPRVPSCC